MSEQEQIVDFELVQTAYAPLNPADRSIVLDMQCRTIDGRRIVIESRSGSRNSFENVPCITPPCLFIVNRQALSTYWNKRAGAAYDG